MKVNRTELLSTLKLVSPALASREVDEQTTSFAFTDGRVLTYNDEISVSHPLDLGGLTGAVRAKELLALLSKMKDDEVDVEADGTEFRVSGKRSRAGIAMEAEISLPLDSLSPPDRWAKLPEKFLDALRFCAPTAGDDMSKRALTCLNVTGDRMESCDNFRISRHVLGGKVKEPFLFPASSARELPQYEPVEYGVSEGWVHFRNADDVTFSSRTAEEEYPDVGKFLNLSSEAAELRLPSDLAGMLSRAGVFSKADFRQEERVSITLDGKRFKIAGKSAIGWFEEDCPLRWEGKGKVEFSVHPDFLREIADKTPSVLIDEGLGRLKIEGEGFEHLIVLSVS